MVEFGHSAKNDQWVIEAVFPGLRGGYFIEAGACGGHKGSASYVLEREFGWNGICVEPLPTQYERLCKLRSCETDNRCISNTTGDFVEFRTYPDDPPRSGIDSLNINGKWAEKRGAREVMLTKETVTLADLLEQHNAPPTIHYVCLDVEGAELVILEPFDFDGDRRMLALSIEGPKCDALLAARGYIQVANPYAPDFYDRYFVHNSISDQVRHLAIV
jgi:FkbM family methyltransferase